MNLKIKFRSGDLSDIPLPEYMTEGSSGMDIRAAVHEAQILKPLERACIPTGLHVSIPPGFEGQVRPRSGLAVKHGVTVLNTPGTIDSDYRGEIKVILINLGSEDFIINRGDRIAQLVFAQVTQAKLILETDIDSTERGAGGFGHTGK
jgi:dUTP pyrophosphatase